MQPLLERQVVSEQVELDFDLSAVDNIFWRALPLERFRYHRNVARRFTASCSRAAKGLSSAFPSSRRGCFVTTRYMFQAAADIATPAQLAGRRIGVPEYQMTAAVWMRGILPGVFRRQGEGRELGEGRRQYARTQGGKSRSNCRRTTTSRKFRLITRSTAICAKAVSTP